MESSESRTQTLAGTSGERHSFSRADLQLADLAVLGALLALTATFGKGFSTLGFSSASIYVSELGLAAAGGLALLRVGPRDFIASIRTRVPLIPLALFWLAGVVAIAQGLREVGLTNTLEDIGLGEYSLVVPLIAVVASTLSRAKLLTRCLAIGLVCGTVVYAFSDLSVRLFGADGTFFDVQEITFGLYMSMLVAYVAGRLASGAEVGRGWKVAGAGALLLVFLTNARGVWISVLVGLAVVTVLCPPGRRLRFGLRAAGAAAAALALAIGIQVLGGGSQIVSEATGAVRGVEQSADGGGGGGDGGGGGGGGSGTNQRVISTEESDNARWRIAFWGEIIDRSVDDPVFGVGYGEPIAFTWMGGKYDFRDGDPAAVIDVDGPHNDYLHVLYRMGYVGLGALLALIIIAVLRVRRALRTADLDPSVRSLIFALTGMFFASATVVFFADALKGPYLGLFFWAALGLLLVAASATPKRDAEATDQPPATPLARSPLR